MPEPTRPCHSSTFSGLQHPLALTLSSFLFLSLSLALSLSLSHSHSLFLPLLQNYTNRPRSPRNELFTSDSNLPLCRAHPIRSDPIRAEPSGAERCRSRNAAVSYKHINRPQWARGWSKNSATKIASASTRPLSHTHTHTAAVLVPGRSLFYVRRRSCGYVIHSLPFPLACRCGLQQALTPARLSRSLRWDAGRCFRASLRVAGEAEAPGAVARDRGCVLCAGPSTGRP